MSKKSTLGPSYNGLKKIGQNAMLVTLLKQLPQTKIWPWGFRTRGLGLGLDNFIIEVISPFQKQKLC